MENEEAEKQKQAIQKKWLTPGSAAGYSSLSRFIQNTTYSKAQAREALNDIPAYSVHKGPLRKRFKRRPVMVLSPFHTIAIDLGVMLNFKWSQSGTRAAYFLVAVCVFSQYMWLRKLASKESKSVVPALRSILKTMTPTPTYFWGDKESAFLSHAAKALFKEYGCKFYSTTGAQTKSVYSEIGVRKAKSKLYMHMTRTGRKNWVAILDQVCRGLNNTKIPALGGLTPNQARLPEFQDKVFHHKFHRVVTATPPTTRFKVNQWVRISKDKISLGAKNYTQNFTDEKFQIIRSMSKNNSVFVHYLADKHHNPIQGMLLLLLMWQKM